MNLEQIEAIQAIVTEGSFRAAAQKLNRSQPSLSLSVKNLEEEFNVEIFDRSSYRPTLTPKGKILVEASRGVLDSAKHFSRVAHELGNEKTEIEMHIAVDPLVPLDFLETIAHECARPLVPVKLIIERSLFHGGSEKLKFGQCALALGPAPDDTSHIELIPISHRKLICAISRKLLAEKHRPDKKFLQRNPQIVVYEKSYDEDTDAMLPNPILEGGGPVIFVPDHFTKTKLIQTGVGWGRISEDELDQNRELVQVPESICPSKSLQICLMRPKRRAIGPTARKIWDTFLAQV